MALSNYSIDAYYKMTRIANTIFFPLFLVSVPLYCLAYYGVFIGYLVYEGPVYLPDSLYCISYCTVRCFSLILLGNVLAASVYSVINLFSPYYLAKCAAYLISLLTLPFIMLVVYLSAYYVSGSIWENVLNIIQGSTTIMFGGVLVSLIPPFCRRRAHRMAGILLSGMNACKIAVHSVIWEAAHLSFVPGGFSLLYLMIVRVHWMWMSSIEVSEFASFCHRFICIGSGAFIRIYFTLIVFKRIFKVNYIEKLRRKLVLLFASGFLFSVLGALVTGECLAIEKYTTVLLPFLFYALKLSFSYWVPFKVLLLNKSFEDVSVISKRSWMKNNKMHFVYFEVCRCIFMLFVTLLPLCITYYIFESYHGDTTSEISITLSFMRMTFSYLFNGMEAAVLIIYIGQRLSLPQKVAKRVTYTDIIHMYRPSMFIAHRTEPS
ncbi:hypothetical protein NEAUS03_1157 [Nematocida ausubeli]|nr:hypothetical protein NEAUS03_1157 [Nematocida ausubeli]